MARRERTSSKRGGKKGSGRSVDFSKEVKWFEPDMEYELVVKSAAWEDGAEYPYIAIEFNGVDENEESTLYHNATTSPKALHRLRNLLEALGQDVPEGEMDIDTEELVGAHCMCHTFEDEYRSNDGEKKKSVKADDFWPVETKGKKGAKGKAKKDEDDDEPKGKKGKSKGPDKIAKSDVEEMEDRDDLEELIETYSLDIDPTSRKLKKDDDALKEAIIEALEDGDHFEEEKKSSKGKRGAKKDEEEEDDEPKGKAGRSSSGKGGSKRKQKTWTEDEVDDMSEEELQDVVDTAELDLDLDDHRSLRKKKNAVKDALEEADKLG